MNLNLTSGNLLNIDTEFLVRKDTPALSIARDCCYKTKLSRSVLNVPQEDKQNLSLLNCPFVSN